MLSQRRRHSRWRMFLVLLVFVGLIRHSELTSAGISESSSLSSAPAARKKSQDLGSLNDFSWQAWFMVDAQTGAQPGMDSATLLRRITPKSIFIAPVLPACPDGYQEDAMERCVKNVNLDENAHFSFLLQRLNNLYANPKTSPQNKQPTGPLQLNIPLMPSSGSESKKVETAETLSQTDPLAAVVDEIALEDDAKKTKHEATATAYEVKNDTASDDDKEKEEDISAFFHENSRLDNVDKNEQKPDAAVPVAEIVETNDTSFSGVVDYKIPTDLKTLLNASGAKEFNTSDTESKDASTTDKLVNSTEMSPIMQLLSSTVIPSTTSRSKIDDVPLAENNTVNQAFNHTTRVSAKEINDNVSDSSGGLPSIWKTSEMDKHRDNETRAEDKPKELESSKLDELHETDFLYDEEEEDDYVYGTDIPNEESTEAEGEEILKHGEAGMTIPTRSPGQLYREQQRLQVQQQQNQTADRKKVAISARDQVVIRFNDSTPTDKDEVETNVSSEVSIDGDLILETTLLDVNTEKLQVTSTQSPDGEVTTKIDNSDDSREPYDQDHRTSAPEVVFSPRESHSSAFTSSGIHERDHQAEHSTRVDTPVEDERREETLKAASESLFYDFPEQDHITEMIEEGQVDVFNKDLFEDNSKSLVTTPRNTRSDSFVRFDDLERVPASHDLLEDHVKFPSSSVRQPQQQTYVRFPSNEANSIHSLNYKHHSHRQASNDDAYGSTSTKSSVPIRQKPVYHLPSWKPDRQQDESAAAATAAAQRQKQAPPMLLRLWNKTPLIRDPSIFPVDQFPTNRSGNDDSLEGGPPAGRRLHRSSSLSRSQRADKALVRRRTPISG